MAFLVKDRVQETCAAPGTGTVTLLGAATGYQSFSAAIGANNTTFYAIADQGGANWEVGLGTIGSGGTTLARTTILASSNGGSATNFSSGVQNIWCDYPAGKAILLDPNGDISTPIINISAISGTITTPESITFDTTPSVVPTAVGSLYWDSADGNQTLSLIMAGGNVTQQIGEEQYFRIKASSAITNGQAVMFTGTVGASGALTGAPASGLTDATSTYFMGIATQDIALNNWGYVTQFGLIRGINTTGGAEAWVDGQILYYNPAVAGGLTKTVPSAPAAKIQAAVVVNASSGGSGSLFVRPTINVSLEDLNDVETASATTNDLLQYDGSKWLHKAPSTVTGVGSALTLTTGRTIGITGDLTYTSPSFNGSGNVTAAGTLATVNSNVGSFTNASVTVNAKGLVTAVSSGTAPVTSVTGTSPIASSGGATPAISMAKATSSVDGYLSSTDWTTFNSKGNGTVTSVTGTGTVNGISLSGTVTSSGNLILGGTLDLSSPPTIGNTAPNTGKFTTLETTGTSSLGTALAQYIQVVGNATEPQLLAAGSGTNIPLVLQPKGTGALQAQATTSSTVGGNARGANAVDWQTIRGNANQVASSSYATLSGGNNNRASGFGSTVSGGEYNNATAVDTGVVGGNQNTASGGYSFVGSGLLNQATGFFNFIGGGRSNSGTANAVVTTQATTSFTSGSTAVTLSGSNAAIKVGQYITGTGINTDTYVAAISGTSLTLSQNANATGTPTLSFYTPHGVVVGGGNNQATGSYSFIGGGGDAGTAANRNVASGDWSFVGGGFKNTASANQSAVLGGDTNTASGQNSTVLGGTTNTASNIGASVLGGYNNTANATLSTVVGARAGTTRSIAGNTVFPASNYPMGVVSGIQAAMLVLARQTTDATPTVLASDSSAAGTTNQVILPNNSAYYFKVRVISGVTGAGNTKAWTLEGAIKRGANAASTALVGTPVVNTIAADSGASTWVIAATADTTNGGLAITFTGQASTTIRTVCKVETTEMTY